LKKREGLQTSASQARDFTNGWKRNLRKGIQSKKGGSKTDNWGTGHLNLTREKVQNVWSGPRDKSGRAGLVGVQTRKGRSVWGAALGRQKNNQKSRTKRPRETTPKGTLEEVTELKKKLKNNRVQGPNRQEFVK